MRLGAVNSTNDASSEARMRNDDTTTNTTTAAAAGMAVVRIQA